MINKTKILFISKHVVHDGTSMGGHHLFLYNLNKCCEDENFEVGYIVVHKGDDDYKKMRQKFASKAIDFSIKIPIFLRIFTYLHYNTFLRILLSMFNSKLYYLDFVSEFLYVKALKKVKKSNWIPDIVNLEFTEVIFLFKKVDRIFNDSLKIVTEHDVSFVKLYRKYGNVKLHEPFLKKFKKNELSVLKNAHLVAVFSNDDLKRLKECNVDLKKIFLLNPYYQAKNTPQQVIENKILFYGAMNRNENQEAVEWFITHVFVPNKLFNTHTFIIIGAGISSTTIAKYESIKNVNFTGYVKDPSIYFENALCMVAPLLNGGGIKIKILEAMSCSVTVLTNNIGIEGIDAIDGKSYLHCTNPNDYFMAITNLSNDISIAKKIGEQGRLMVENKYDFEKTNNAFRGKLLQMAQHDIYLNSNN